MIDLRDDMEKKRRFVDMWRVIHLPTNTASVPNNAVNALTRHGFEASGLILGCDVHPYLESESLVVIPWLRVGKREIELVLNAPTRLFYLLFVARHFQIFHYHTSALLPSGLERFLMRFTGKRAVVQFHGTDIRIPEIEFLTNIYYKTAFLRGEYAFKKYENYKTSRALQNKRSKLSRVAIVAPELVRYIDRNLFLKVYIVFHPIDVNRIVPSYPDPYEQVPMIVHAPSNPGTKGTAYVERALRVLKEKLGLRFEYRVITGLPHDQAMDVMRRADIYLDQFVLGHYAVASIEAMALGKPVVCHIDPSVRASYPADLPVVIANPDNLAQKIAELLKDGSRRREVGMRSREYAERVHSYEAYASHLEKIYSEIMELPESYFWGRRY